MERPTATPKEMFGFWIERERNGATAGTFVKKLEKGAMSQMAEPAAHAGAVS